MFYFYIMLLTRLKSVNSQFRHIVENPNSLRRELRHNRGVGPQSAEVLDALDAQNPQKSSNVDDSQKRKETEVLRCDE